MFNVKLLLPISFITILLPTFSLSAYSASDYNPEYTPYNLQKAIDSRLCKEEVTAFDSDYDALGKSYTGSIGQVILQSGIQGSLNNINAWFESSELYYSNLFKKCIDENNAAEAEKDKQRAREKFEQEQLAKLQKAIEKCDMEYLENLSDKDKMATYDERTACKEKLSTESVNTPSPAPVQIPTYVPPVVTDTPPLVSPKPTPYVQESRPVITETNSEPDIELATTSASTTEEKLVEMSEEELNKMIEQRVSEALKESQVIPEPQPEKPSFFKRVINFFKSWF